MDNKINNRLEAFLSWISTGVKPEGWDLEPRNKEEYYLAAEADRIDQIEQGGGPTPPPPPAGPTDYNELINKPIDPYPTDRAIIPIEGSEVNFEVGMILHGDDTKVDDMIAYLHTLTYTVGEEGKPGFCFITGEFKVKGAVDANTIVAVDFPAAFIGKDHNVKMILVYPITTEDMKPEYFFFVEEDLSIGPNMGFTKGYQHDVDIVTTSAVPVNQNIDIETFNSLVSLLGVPEIDAGTYYYKAGEPATQKQINTDDTIDNVIIPTEELDSDFLSTLSYGSVPGLGMDGSILLGDSKGAGYLIAINNSELSKYYDASENMLGTIIYFDTTATPNMDSDDELIFIDITDSSNKIYFKENINNNTMYLTADSTSSEYNSETDVLVYDGSQFVIDHYILKNFAIKGTSEDKSFNEETLEGLFEFDANSKFRNHNNYLCFINPDEYGDGLYGVIFMLFIWFKMGIKENYGFALIPGTFNIYKDGILFGTVKKENGEFDMSTYSHDVALLLDNPISFESLGMGISEFTVGQVQGPLKTVVPAVPAQLSLGDDKVLLATEVADHVYKHNIILKLDNGRAASLIIYNNQASSMTALDIYNYLKNNNYKNNGSFYPNDNFYGLSSGYSAGGSNWFGISAYTNYSSERFDFLSYNGSGTVNNYSYEVEDVTATDNVETIL